MTTNVEEKKEAAADLKDAAATELGSTAQTAKEQAGQVASTAVDEAQQLATEATDHAKALLNEGRQQAEEQSRIQRDKLVGTLQTVGDDLEQMASSAQGGLAADLTRQVADQARRLSSSIEGREPAELLGDVRAYAQRKPGTFLLGALAAGVVAGRLLRGAKDAPPSTVSRPAPTPEANGLTTGGLAPSPAVTSSPVVPPQTSGALSSDLPAGGVR